MGDRNGVKLFNYVRSTLSDSTQKIIPTATDSNILGLKDIMFNQDFKPQFNEFVGSLVNRIFTTIIKNKSFSNPLAILKGEKIPLGSIIQGVYTNPPEGKDYEMSESAMADILRIYEPDTKTEYYGINMRKKYPLTLAYTSLEMAFNSWGAFESYIESQTTALYAAAYIDEYNYTKNLIDGAYSNNKAVIQTIAPLTDEASTQDFIIKLRTIFNNMLTPSSDYSAYSEMSSDEKNIVTWTTPERIIILIDNETLAKVDVYSLAKAFNIEYADLIARVVPINHFINPKVHCIICDESYFQINEKILEIENFYNISTRSWQLMLHFWEGFNLSAFAPAVILAEELPSVLTNIQISDAPIEITGVGIEEGLDVTLTPANTTGIISYYVDDEKIVSIDKTKTTNAHVALMSTGIGSTILHAFSDNGLTAQIEVTVKEA